MWPFKYKHYFVVIEEKDGGDITPKRQSFVMRDRNGWVAFDAIKEYLQLKQIETGNKWTVISMNRI